MSQGIKILLVDDHTLFREGLGRLLQSEPELKLVGNCGSVCEGLNILEKEQIDIVLLDYDLGDEQGMSFQKEAARRGFKGRVLLVTAGMSEQEMVAALETGISGIFLKSSTPAQLIEAVRRVVRGEPWLDPKAMKALISAATGKSHQQESAQPLSARERAVLKGIFEGLANKEIAAELKISESSVKAVIQQLFEKTGVRTRGQLVRIALERRDQGWI
jgi:DNA-binding NarL/FixJ family response regulator